MKLLLKGLALLVAGAVVLTLGMFLLGLVATAMKLAFWIAVVAAVGWGAVKVLAAMESAPAAKPSATSEASEAKTEESKALTAPEAAPASKPLSDADALKMFEEARRKNTNSQGTT